jgi:hypothetical protein
MKYGLEVQYCENLMGHKRHYQMLQQQAEDEVVITFDDDILFPRYCIERIMDTHRKFPDCIVCDRGQTVTWDENGKPLQPAYWNAKTREGTDSPSYRVMASPGGGCLFPKNSLYRDFCDSAKIKEYALCTGNVWLMFMAVQNGTKIVKTSRYHKPFVIVEDEQEVRLGVDAVSFGRYEKTIDTLKHVYPLAYSRIFSILRLTEQL